MQCGAHLKLFHATLEIVLVLYCYRREKQCTKRHDKSSIAKRYQHTTSMSDEQERYAHMR